MEIQKDNIESGVQLFSRINYRNALDGINPKYFPNGGPYQNEIIEISGESRHNLLLDFIVRSILPTTLNREWKQCGTVFVNTDHQISLLKIVKTVDQKLKELNVVGGDRKALTEEALKNLTIVNCYDNEDFELTLHNLERIIQNQRNATSLLVIDNIAAHYWLTAKQTNDKMLSQSSYMTEVLRRIKTTIKDLNLVLIYSKDNDKSHFLMDDVCYKLVASVCKKDEVIVDENIYLNT